MLSLIPSALLRAGLRIENSFCWAGQLHPGQVGESCLLVPFQRFSPNHFTVAAPTRPRWNGTSRNPSRTYNTRTTGKLACNCSTAARASRPDNSPKDSPDELRSLPKLLFRCFPCLTPPRHPRPSPNFRLPQLCSGQASRGGQGYNTTCLRGEAYPVNFPGQGSYRRHLRILESGGLHRSPETGLAGPPETYNCRCSAGFPTPFVGAPGTPQ